MSILPSNVRLAIRSLARRPSFVAVVVLTFALGIGANSAIFSVVNAVLLKPLPYRAPDELVLLWSRWINFEKTWLSDAEYLDYQEMTDIYADAASWADGGEVALTGDGSPESVIVENMTWNLLNVVGMAPALGRGFTLAEDTPNGPPVAMIGYDLWRRRYAGDPSIIGRQIRLNGAASTVIGVLPRDFRFPLEFQSRSPAQVVLPMGMDRANPQRGNHGLYGVARLRPGVTVDRASAAMAAMAVRVTNEGLYPVAMRFTAFATGLRDEVTGKVALPLIVLSAATALLLLLTCANVANLVLTRADGRSREVAVRAALGAGWRDMLRLALTENLVLSLTGGALGFALAWVGVRVLVARAPTTIPRLGELSVDWKVATVAFGLSLVTGLIVGLVPVLRVGRVDLARSLHDGGRGGTGGAARRRGRDMLVVAEMALAVLLVIGAGLTVRSFRNLQRIDPGFDASNVLTFRLVVPPATYPQANDVVGFFQRLGDQVRAIPGVTAAGFIRVLPLAAEIGDGGLVIDGKPLPAGAPGRSGDWQAVTPGYFEAMHIRLMSGRFLDTRDTPNGAPVIAINETLAREYFPGEDAIGQRIRTGNQQGPFRTIVAVVGDHHHNGLTNPVKRAFFVPHNQWPASYGGNARRGMTMAVRTTGDPRVVLPEIERLVKAMDPELPFMQVQTMGEVLARATREQRFTMGLMAGFAALALVLAAVGIYGVVSHSVNQRTREIGIRLTLGARAETVRALVLRQGIVPASIGVALGLGAAFVLTRHLRTILYGVAPIDLLTFGTMPALLLIVAATSVLIPAGRASRMDPVRALRVE